MKKLTILLFSILISFNSYGEWVQVSTSVTGMTTFVNIDKIKENNDYIYYWTLTNNYTDDSNKSAKAYRKSDCAVNRFKVLAFYSYSEPMGGGRLLSQFTPPDEWQYAIPNSVDDTLLTYTCNH